jgi:outer membrane protein assembly factor BamB
MSPLTLRRLLAAAVAMVALCLVAGSARAASVPDTVSRVRPAVVMIEARSGEAMMWGTAFFVSSEGVLLTNNHVIQDAQHATVIYRNHDRLEATVLAADAEADLAVLKVDAGGPFPTVALGDSDELQEGVAVAVTGYPTPRDLVWEFGTSVQSSTTFGAVSALRRSAVPGVVRSRPLLQYDAATSHGNSGGPIYRLDTGEVVGVTRLGAPAGESLYLGVPINEAKLILQRAGVSLRPNVADPSAPECQVPPGDISVLNTIGPDKTLTSLLASNWEFGQDLSGDEERLAQLRSNAGYYTCYGELAPVVSAPTEVGDKLVLTGGDGHVYLYDPSSAALREERSRPIFDTESQFMFSPAVAGDRQIYFAAGTPTFAAAERTDPGLAILSILSAAGGGGPVNATKLVATMDAKGSIFAINPTNGNLDWEYKAGFAGPPVVAGDNVYFGGVASYGAIERTSGREVWAKKEKLGGRGAAWNMVAFGGGALSVLVAPVKVEFRDEYPGYAVLGDGDVMLMSVSLTDGRPIWRTKVTNINGQANPFAFGFAVDGKNGRVLVSRNQQVWAFSPEGKPLWVYGEDQSKRRKPKETQEVKTLLEAFATGFAFDDSRVYLGGDDGKVYALSAATGQEAWTYTGLGVMGDTALVDGALVCGNSRGWLHALDPTSGQLRWKVQTRVAMVGRAIARDGVLYFAGAAKGHQVGLLNAVYMPRKGS